MANLIKPEYNCSQKDLYSILETAWANYQSKLADFEDLKAFYTATYGSNALAALAVAKAIPDLDARTTVAETMRVELVGLGRVCLKNFQKLKSYIESAFVNRALWNIQFEGAGQNYYAEAANEDWESMELLMQSGKNYIAANEALLEGVAPMLNMPATFPTAFTVAADLFSAKYGAFKLAEETSAQTAAKVSANNDCFRTAMDMMRDGQVIYMDELETRKLFVFTTIWELINPPVSGVKGSVKASGTNVPLAGAIVKTQKTGEVAVETLVDVDGKYSKLLSEGEFTITVNVAGYITQSVTVTLHANGYKTFDFVMIPV